MRLILKKIKFRFYIPIVKIKHAIKILTHSKYKPKKQQNYVAAKKWPRHHPQHFLNQLFMIYLQFKHQFPCNTTDHQLYKHYFDFIKPEGMSQTLQQSTAQVADESLIWGKLVSLNGAIPDYEMKDLLVTIGRHNQCTIQLKNPKLSARHCSIENKCGQIYLMDLSTNGTYFENKIVGKGKSVALKNNSEIWLQPANNLKGQQTFGYRLQLTNKSQKVEEQYPV